MRRIIVAPLEKSEIYRATKIEFQNQSKGRILQTYSAVGCCFFWLLNSALGLMILTQYPHIHESHP